MMPTLRATVLADGPADGTEVLVVGPSLGTAVAPLWRGCAAYLSARYRVVGWDLPGHGASAACAEPLTMSDLAASVGRLVATLRTEHPGRRVGYAGVSVGGCVGLQLVLDLPGVVESLAVVCSSSVIGEPAAWRERAELVRRAGTPVMVEGSAKRWFAPGSIDRDPATAAALLSSLQDADAASYARVCEALAGFDVTDRLGEVDLPVLALAGAHDPVVTPADAEALAAALPQGTARIVADAGHLAPAEQPAAVATLLTDPTALGDAHDADH